MGKIQFLMDTSGHCFLCLKLTALANPTISEGKNGGPGMGTPLSEQNVPCANIVSFRNICEYLKINLKEVCTEAMPVSTPSSSSSILERSELNGMLCADCIQPFRQFSKDFLELEGLRLKLKFSLKLIYERMVGERKDGRRLEELIRKQTSLKNGFVEQFRRKTLERCSTMVDSGRPLVLLKKVTKSVEGFIPVIDLTSEYLEPVDIQSSVKDATFDVAESGPLITQEKVGETNIKEVDQSVAESPPKSVENINVPPIEDERENTELIQKATVEKTTDFAKNFRLKWGGFQRKRTCPKKFAMSLPMNTPTQSLQKKKDSKKLISEERAEVMTSSFITSESTPEVPPESEKELERPIADPIISTIIPGEHECDICHDKFLSRKAKCDHQRAKHEGMKFGCDICKSKTFALRYHRDKHKQTCTPHCQPGVLLNSKTKRGRPATLQARNTKRPRLKSLQGLKPKLKIQQRKATKRKNDNPTEGTLISQENKSQQKCKFCDTQFRTKKMLRRHLTVVHRAKFECEFCQKLFSSSRSSRLHRQTVHLGRRFPCKYCSQVFSQSATRNRHMKKTCTMRNGAAERKSDSIATSLKTRQCQRLISETDLIPSGIEPVTEYDHSKMNPLNFEQVSVSNDETGMEDDGNQMEMECDVCQEKVSDPADHKCTLFETHLTINEKGEVEGEEVIPKLPLLIITQPTSSIKKRYKCNLCLSEFRVRSAYVRHHRDDHMGIRYKCDFCINTFIEKMELLEHRQVVHFEKTGYQLSTPILNGNTSDINLLAEISGTGDTQNKEASQQESMSRSMSPSRPVSYASERGSQKPYKFCVCKTKQVGRMVRCENNTCKFGVWFHYDNDPPCVQYNNEEVWYCSMCQTISNCREVKTSIRKSKV